jgi:hypothetical protein
MTDKKKRRTQAQLIAKHRADATYADAQADKWRDKALVARTRAAEIENDIRASFEALEK